MNSKTPSPRTPEPDDSKPGRRATAEARAERERRALADFMTLLKRDRR